MLRREAIELKVWNHGQLLATFDHPLLNTVKMQTYISFIFRTSTCCRDSWCYSIRITHPPPRTRRRIGIDDRLGKRNQSSTLSKKKLDQNRRLNRKKKLRETLKKNSKNSVAVWRHTQVQSSDVPLFGEQLYFGRHFSHNEPHQTILHPSLKK